MRFKQMHEAMHLMHVRHAAARGEVGGGTHRCELRLLRSKALVLAQAVGPRRRHRLRGHYRRRGMRLRSAARQARQPQKHAAISPESTPPEAASGRIPSKSRQIGGCGPHAPSAELKLGGAWGRGQPPPRARA